MAAVLAVNVLCPNGRRVTVKKDLNTPLLQILEEACRKQGFEVDLHLLKHGRTVLDLSCPLRFSGLPNNAKLEMVQTEQPRRASVQKTSLMVQVEDGRRVPGSFLSSTSLWSVLEELSLLPSDSSYIPELVCMRQKVNGEQQLRKTTLRDLGLSGGHAAVRLVYHISQEKTSHAKQGSLEQEGSFKDQENILKQEVTEKGESHEENENMDVGKGQSEQNMSPSAMSIEEESNVTLHDPHLQDTPMLLVEPAVKPVDRDIQSQRRRQPYSRGVSSGSADLGKHYEDPCERETMIFLRSDDSLLVTPSDEIPDEFFQPTVSDVQYMQDDLRRQVKDFSNVPLTTEAMRQCTEQKKLEHYSMTVIRVHLPNQWVLQGCFKPGESVRAVVLFVRQHLLQSDLKFYLFTTPPKTILRSALPTLGEAGFVPAANLHLGLRSECVDESSQLLSSDSLDHYTCSAVQAELASTAIRERCKSGPARAETHPLPSPHPSASEATQGAEENESRASSSVDTSMSTGRSRIEGGGEGGGGRGTGNRKPKWFTAGLKH